jgi:hypothetical protein
MINWEILDLIAPWVQVAALCALLVVQARMRKASKSE